MPDKRGICGQCQSEQYLYWSPIHGYLLEFHTAAYRDFCTGTSTSPEVTLDQKEV